MITRLMLLFVWLVMGCANRQYAPSSAARADYGYALEAPAPPLEAEMDMDGDGVTVAEARRLDPFPSQVQVSKPRPTTIRPKDPVPAGRMVHYDGWARMRVTQPESVLDQVANLATEVGGRVDRLTGSFVTVRVPVDSFNTVWSAVLELGDVLDKRVRADDVTEQFLAVDLRVRTLKTMQDRLIRLLGRAKTEQEKLALLQEITRVTEELDATESRLRTLKDLASMSKITLEVIPREAFGQTTHQAELSGFEWIRSLSPFNRSVWDDDKRIGLDAPEEMVALDKRGPYIAEGPNGTVLWTMRVTNDPVGDGNYWVDAIEQRISQEFADATRSRVGDWACLSLMEPGADEPYRWDICLREAGKHLEVAQAYFPSPDHVARFADRIADRLGGGGAP